jgi:hypothetical protein
MSSAPPSSPTSTSKPKASVWGRMGVAFKRRRCPSVWYAA